MSKHTKIVATISDKRCDIPFIQDLYDAGMNVVRLNSAHLNREGFLKIINNVRAVSKQIAILMDTKGPEIRTTNIEGGEDLLMKTGDKIKIVGDPSLLTNKDCIAVTYANFVKDLNIGDDVLFDDGEIDLKVVDKTSEYLLCEVLNEGKLGNRKSVNIPGVRINLPSLTQRDIENIQFSIEAKIKKGLIISMKFWNMLME
jgi:pyruvate kinase